VDEVVVAMHVRNLDSGEWAQKTLNQKQFLTQTKIFRLFLGWGKNRTGFSGTFRTTEK
jgi:hypothetical protein